MKRLISTALVPCLAAGLLAAEARAGELTVIGTEPGLNEGNVPVLTPVRVHFDQAVDPASVHSGTFFVFGRASGTTAGTYSVSEDGTTVTFTPEGRFAAGEIVRVLLSHDVMSAGGATLRSAGYSFQFGTRTRPADIDYQEVQVLDTGPTFTRIYGAAAMDLNHDGFIDLTTVNEVSADLRVFLNLGDGTGTYGNMLSPPVSIGVEASPNDVGDFNKDGHMDLAVGASADDEVWIALGAGDGTYGSTQSIAVGDEPHGIAVLDVDGDGDLDVVAASRGASNLAQLLNDGSGVFGAPTFFQGGVSGEYGIDVGEMNGDGLLDLVVAGRDSEQVRTLLNNGDGTFTQAAPQTTDGQTWVVTLGDVNGDGFLDATTANSNTGNGSLLLGNGDGTFDAPTFKSIGASVVSTDLGDLDGDGDLDWMLSSFGGLIWRMYLNDGAGNFTFERDFQAEANPSCSIMLDIDNDRDLDLALTDEIADLVTIEKNSGTAALGDADGDDDVDGADYVLWYSCLSGPGVDAGQACGDGDFDGDGDLDLVDFGGFQGGFGE